MNLMCPPIRQESSSTAQHVNSNSNSNSNSKSSSNNNNGRSVHRPCLLCLPQGWYGPITTSIMTTRTRSFVHRPRLRQEWWDEHHLHSSNINNNNNINSNSNNTVVFCLFHVIIAVTRHHQHHPQIIPRPLQFLLDVVTTNDSIFCAWYDIVDQIGSVVIFQWIRHCDVSHNSRFFFINRLHPVMPCIKCYAWVTQDQYVSWMEGIDNATAANASSTVGAMMCVLYATATLMIKSII